MSSNSDIEKWNFEEYDIDRSNTSGDFGNVVSKLGEAYDCPGVLKVNSPQAMASLLARESIQNSWDAALERQEFFGNAKKVGFHLEFRFVELKGKKKQQFVEAAGLNQLADHMQNIPDVNANEIVANPKTLTEITNNSEPLKLLYLIERGTTGMYGGWGTPKSKMHLALANFGYTAKPIAGSGGTKGYGKTALARNSGTRTVICYSAFNPSIAPIHPDATHEDGEVTRRIFGMGYWKKHEYRKGSELKSNNGWHRFGYDKTTQQPATDAEADTIANALGVPVRDGQKAQDIGSTFVIIDPIIDANSLVDAVRRWWWPALIDRREDFDVTVTDFDGRELKPNPSGDPELEEFIRAYRLGEDLNPKTEHRAFFQQVTVEYPDEGSQRVDPGVLHLVADPSVNGWTNPYDSSIDLNSDEGISASHASIVALIRKTKMVVRYENVNPAKPYVRGVFLSDPSKANQLLSVTEDALHSDWELKADEDRKASEHCFNFAKSIKSRIRSNTNQFREKFRQAGVSSNEVILNEFDRIMNPLRGKKKTTVITDPVDPKGPRGFDITFPEGRPEPEEFIKGANDGLIKMPGTFKIALDNDQSRESGEVEIEVRFQFERDGKSSSTADYLGSISDLNSIGDPIEWVESSNGSYTGKGTLTKSGVTITAESAAYEDIFTGGWKPVVTGEWEASKGENNDE